MGTQPHVGYVYPAGGQQDTTIHVTAGGQALAGAASVYVSGEGVQGSVVQYARPLNNRQLQTLAQRLRERRAQLDGKKPPSAQASKPNSAKTTSDLVPLPNHPWIQDIDTMTLRDLEHVAQLFFDKKKQPNSQIAEIVLINITIDRTASPGMRELRIGTAAGLTNPIQFEIGALPEVREEEPNDPRRGSGGVPGPFIELPALINGQIMPGDIDRFYFHARQGQRLIAETHARRLIPYLADAVPGWFQAVLTIYDASGREIAYDDDNGFDPDPAIRCTIPADGDYALEIRDALYRGREDFVYRITLGDSDHSPMASATSTNPSFPQLDETEPNDDMKSAQPVQLPRIVTGSIGRTGDADVFQFEGHANQDVAIEVYARRLDSPLDSLVRLIDESGQFLAWNDDHTDPEAGLLTHHADSYLVARLPHDGTYRVELTDAQGHGGRDYRYRLRVGPPQPDFAVRVAPSSINLPAGRSAVVDMHTLRKDGFSGTIRLALKNAPVGFALDGAVIPSECDHVRMTVSCSSSAIQGPFALDIEGAAEVNGQTVRHLAQPAEDMIQAFMYRHLVPSERLLVTVLPSKGPNKPIEIASPTPVRIPLGGAAQVYVKAPVGPILSSVKLELSDPPKGIALTDAVAVPDGMVFEVRADADVAKPGLSDNLIVDAYMEASGAQQSAKPAQNRQRRVPLGALPAIPFEVVAR